MFLPFTGINAEYGERFTARPVPSWSRITKTALWVKAPKRLTTHIFSEGFVKCANRSRHITATVCNRDNFCFNVD